MRQILEQWKGKFRVDGEIYNDLNDLELNDGEDFHIELLSKRRVVDEEKDLLSAY